jgi:hypothetical protein
MILKLVSVLLFKKSGGLLPSDFFRFLRFIIPFELPPVLLGVGWGGGDSDAASGTISKISKCFHGSKLALKTYFSKQ